MLHDRYVSVVVPAFEEALHVGRVIATMPRFVDAIFVVDDGSRDGTQAAALSVGDPRVKVIRHEQRKGVGAAIATGYQAALARQQEPCRRDAVLRDAVLEDGAPSGAAKAVAKRPAAPAGSSRGGGVGGEAPDRHQEAPDHDSDAIAVMAGDGQMAPEDLAAVVMPVVRGQADYVKGDRFWQPEVLAKMGFPRWIGGQIFSRLTSLAIGQSITDSQCGYTAIARKTAGRLDLPGLWPSFGYPNDLLGQLAVRSARIREVPVQPVYGDEQSKLKLRHLPPFFFIIARAAVRRLRASPVSPVRTTGTVEPLRRAADASGLRAS